MTQWQRVKEAFYEARELEPQRLRHFLDSLDDSKLRDEVESLLDADCDDEFCEPPGWATSTPTRQDPRPLVMLPGSRVGPYEIEDRVGTGGMGEVYRAFRVDGSFDRTVAIKVLKRGLDTEPLLERFQREREVLARLDHSNIARLLDAGSLDDGRPYFVMEFVQGEPIDSYCDRLRLNVRERVDLFSQVLSAVEYAHRNLVVHRDLKPSNILVAPDGTPKLLDFGIAKVLDSDGHELTEGTGKIPLTLEYASPEQINGEAITTATDVYSLGVVLFRLLTGGDPYGVTEKHRREIERAICETSPPRPSTAISTARTAVDPTTGSTRVLDPEAVARVNGTGLSQLRRQLSGDLDSIVLKALRKEPESRYRTVDHFCSDLQGYLRGEPVSAHRGDFQYRVQRFVRRYRSVVIIASLITVVLVGATLATAQQAYVASRERDRAVLAQRELEQINDFLQTMLKSPNPARQGRNVTVVEVLDEAANSVASALGDSPEIAATAHTTLGETYHSLGEFDKAARQYELALEIRQQFAEEAPEKLAWSLNNMGFVHYTRAEFDLAVEFFEQAVDYGRRALGNDHPDVAQNLSNLASALHRQKQYDRALEVSAEALRIRETSVGERSLEVAESLNNIANLYRSLDRMDDALATLQRSVSIRRELLDDDHPLLLSSLVNLAVLEVTASQHYEAARALLEKAITGYEECLGPEHPDLAYPLIHLAHLESLESDWAKAEPLLRRAVELRRRAFDPGHRLLAYAEALWGVALCEQGQHHDACALLRDNVEVVANWLGEEHDRTKEIRRMIDECAPEEIPSGTSVDADGG